MRAMRYKGQPRRRLARKNDLLQRRILARINHDLRTPLAAIMGYAELLKETSSPAQREIANGILRNSQTLALELAQLLDAEAVARGEPYCPAANAPPTMSDGEISLEGDCLRGIRVLVVDDAPDIRFFVSRLLQLAGATVEVAVNGAEAVERALAHRPDVVLMDLQMPEVDGYRATRSLRTLGFEAPIVAMSAHVTSEEPGSWRCRGFSNQLKKPVGHNELLRVVKGYERSQLEGRRELH